MQENVYVRLARHLDKLPVGFPATETGVELRILERWFTPREAETALAMSGIPTQPDTIAEKLGIAPEALLPELDVMVDKGLIFRLILPEKRVYNLVPVAEGMWEFHINNATTEDIRLLHEYLDCFMEKGWFGTPTTQHRIVPISTSVTPNSEILPYDRAEEIIRAQKKIVLVPCICRKENRDMGHGCDHLREGCMTFGAGAYFYLQTGRGREVSQQEALDFLKKAMDEGLVCQPGNGQNVWGLCLCCSCCCALLKTFRKMDKPGQVAHTNFYAGVDKDACTGCGACADTCPMQAISVHDTAAQIKGERCIGCGVCAGVCAFDAIQIKHKDAAQRYEPPRDMIAMQVQIAKERGLL